MNCFAVSHNVFYFTIMHEVYDMGKTKYLMLQAVLSFTLILGISISRFSILPNYTIIHFKNSCISFNQFDKDNTPILKETPYKLLDKLLCINNLNSVLLEFEKKDRKYEKDFSKINVCNIMQNQIRLDLRTYTFLRNAEIVEKFTIPLQ